MDPLLAHSQCCACYSCRLPSQGRRILVKKNVSLNGHMHREPSTGYTHLIQRCSVNTTSSQNSTRWLKRQNEELRLQGKPIKRTSTRYLNLLQCRVILIHDALIYFESCRLRELSTLKGHVESVVRLKGLDIDTIQQSYTV